MRNEDQNKKDPKQEPQDAGEQPPSEAKEDDLPPRGRGLSDELVEGETVDIARDPAKPR